MQKIEQYTYMGDNGFVTTSVHLQGVPSLKIITLIADDGKLLTRNGINFYKSQTINEKEVIYWKEVEDKGQN